MWLSRRARRHSRAPVLVEEPPTAPVLTQISPRPLALSGPLLHCACVSQEARITLGLWSRIYVVILPSTPGDPEKHGGVSQLHITSQRPPQAWHKAGPAGACEIDENPVPSAGGLRMYTDLCVMLSPRERIPQSLLTKAVMGRWAELLCFLCLFLKCRALLGEGNFTR